MSHVMENISMGLITTIDNGFAFKSDEYTNKGLRVIRIMNVQKGQIIDNLPNFISEDREEEFTKYLLYEDDLLMSLTGDVGRVGRMTSDLLPAVLNQRVARIKIKDTTTLNSRYLFYVLMDRHFEENAILNSSGTAQKNMSTQWLKTYKVPLINLKVQQKIADFLDTETAQIDNLIAKQERLLELLEEKRRATITHAVTRGLNPSVELKETNIPWLSQVPQHWKVGKIYQYCTTGSGTTPNSNLGDWYTDTESGTPWVTTGELRESLIMTTKVKVTEVAIQKHSALKVYPAGTLLIAMYGATIGRLGTLGVSACTNQACCALKPSESLLNKYLYYYLLGMREQLLFLSSGGGQPNISKEKIDSFPLLLPDRTEQLEIANWLDSQEDKVDKLKQKIQTQITLLRERRTSLISHAVTGKVKIT